MKQKILFWGAFLLCCLLAVYFAVRTTFGLLGHSGALDIRKISLSSESGEMDSRAIVAALNIPNSMPSYRVNLHDALARVMLVPDVDAASVRRLGNGNLAIRVRVKKAVATWTDGTNYYPLSADGTLINRPSDTKPEHSLLFRGAIPDDISDFVNAIKQSPALLNATDYIEWIEDRRWNIHISSGAVIKLPETEWKNAIEKLGDMNKKTNIFNRTIKTIDLRDISRVLVDI